MADEERSLSNARQRQYTSAYHQYPFYTSSPTPHYASWHGSLSATAATTSEPGSRHQSFSGRICNAPGRLHSTCEDFAVIGTHKALSSCHHM
ncbi:hypothetical protein OE88DRAFT_1656298 [Heliocybe sulcata]|uniref:Uncharacterized protein n=1 Tax=Heliocybe sulcata TaxID=5364 RepID=A0A5C3NGS7_9AGAM|nr:hypothetical protein OE88DRAFT_1656298 [Heliocybe sulcata]